MKMFPTVMVLLLLVVAPVSAGETTAADTAFREGRYDEALRAYQLLEEAEPGHPFIQFRLALSAHIGNHLERALPLYETASAHPENRGGAYYNMACIYSRLGRLTEGLAFLEKAYQAGFAGDPCSDPELKALCGDPRYKAPPEARVEEITLQDGTSYRFLVITPRAKGSTGFPTLLAFAPGTQTRNAVDWAMGKYWGVSAATAGWLTISPLGPEGGWFTPRARRHLPLLLAELKQRYQLQGGRFHLAGASNGGMVALTTAVEQPQFFHSLALLSGCPRDTSVEQKLGELAGMKVRSFYNLGDSSWWVTRIERAHLRMEELGIDLEVHAYPAQGHIVGALSGGILIEQLSGP